MLVKTNKMETNMTGLNKQWERNLESCLEFVGFEHIVEYNWYETLSRDWAAAPCHCRGWLDRRTSLCSEPAYSGSPGPAALWSALCFQTYTQTAACYPSVSPLQSYLAHHTENATIEHLEWQQIALTTGTYFRVGLNKLTLLMPPHNQFLSSEKQVTVK